MVSQKRARQMRVQNSVWQRKENWRIVMIVTKPRGGLWLDLKKSPASERPIGEPRFVQRFYLPLRQCRGVLPTITVSQGEHVFMGEPIAQTADGISCSLHSPVSGLIESISEYDHPLGGKSLMLVINNDGQDAAYKKAGTQKNTGKLTGEEIITAVERAGIVATGGLEPPLWVKLRNLSGKKVKAIVINAVETEPYICSSQKLIGENPESVAEGLKLLLQCVGTAKAVVAMSDDIPRDILHGLLETARLAGVSITAAHIPQKYPLGNELFLEQEIFSQQDGRHSSAQGETLFVTAQDCANVSRAVLQGEPQISRIITVAGDAVKNPQNLEVRIGTTVRDVLDHCGLAFDPDRVVLGSPLRGVAVSSLSTPITKSVEAVLALKASYGGMGKSICINCGKCVSVCPQGLLPNYIAMRAVKADFDALHDLRIERCIECGSCAYICPGRMPIVELIKNIKKAAL